MVRHGINEAEEAHDASITNEPARDVPDRDDDRLRCAASRGPGDGGLNTLGDWNELQEPPAEQLDSHRADAHGKNIERAPGGADADADRLYGYVNDDHCLGIGDGIRRDSTVHGRHRLLPNRGQRWRPDGLLHVLYRLRHQWPAIHL